MSNKGLSLVETLFSFWVTCFIVLAVINLFPSSMLAVRRGENEILANARAQSVLEEVRTQPFESLELGHTTRETVYGPDQTEYVTGVDVLKEDGSEVARLKRLKVTVSWQYRQETRTVVQELLLCNVVGR